MRKVLITGMSGLIGGILRDHLENVGGYELSALNRRKVEGLECHQADISNLEAIRPAFKDKEVVVHLAASLENRWDQQLSNNITGVYNVYQAAVDAGVQRVVFASSGSTIRGFDLVHPYSAIAEGRYEDVTGEFTKISHEVFRPNSIYGAAKVWGEALGRYFADAYGLSVLCVRIGSVNRENRPSTPREVSAYLSHRDIASILQRCIDAPADMTYDVFFALSDNRWGVRDLEHSQKVLGWVPHDSGDEFPLQG